MSNTTHTPTPGPGDLPLKISSYKGIKGRDIFVETGYTENSKPGQLVNGQRTVFKMCGTGSLIPGDRETIEAWAAHITTAVNNHARLVEYVTAISRFTKAGRDSDDDRDTLNRLREDARKLLAEIDA